MRDVPRPISPARFARIGLGVVSLLVGAALLAAGESDRSSAQDHSEAFSAATEASTALLKSPSSATASSRARSRRATRLRAIPGCNSKRDPFVRVRWIPARKRGRAQRVEYTEFFRGFASHNFHKSRKLGPRRRRWRTANIETGVDYNWRVMTRRAHRWVSSKVRSFDGPLCLG
jgi:hypothetical protein